MVEVDGRGRRGATPQDAVACRTPSHAQRARPHGLFRQPRLPQEPRRHRGHARRRARHGYRLTTEPAEAEVIVVNTCGFIGEAKKESIETIFELVEMKKRGACKKLVVTGCLSQRYPRSSRRRCREVDHFLGSSDMLRLGDVLDGKAEGRMLVGNPADWLVRASDPRVVTGSTVSAYLKIAEGCNRTCAFCTIPELRGRQRSRPAGRRGPGGRAARGAGDRRAEHHLAGHDRLRARPRRTARQRRGRSPTSCARVADVQGDPLGRLFYLYPETIDDALVDLLANHPRVVPYVDMPLQHAADAMLKRMRRGHGKERQSARGRAPAQGSAGALLPDGVHRGAPRRDRRRVRGALRFRRVGEVRARRRLPLLGRGVARFVHDAGQGEAARRRQPLPQAHGAAAPDLAREVPHARRQGARCARRRAERGARARPRRAARGAGAGRRRQGVPLGGRGLRRDRSAACASTRRATTTFWASCSATPRRRTPRSGGGGSRSRSCSQGLYGGL